jgi:formylglycine-generating enzyme required for sulfatase activity
METNSGSSTHPVGTKMANELGIYDMSGNVWEWCYDWKGSYPASMQNNPMGASSGSSRVNRGGGWSNIAGYCRVANRNDNSPGFRSYGIGFRIACSSE